MRVLQKTKVLPDPPKPNDVWHEKCSSGIGGKVACICAPSQPHMPNNVQLQELNAYISGYLLGCAPLFPICFTDWDAFIGGK